MQIPSSFWDQMLKIPNNQKRKYKKNFQNKTLQRGHYRSSND